MEHWVGLFCFSFDLFCIISNRREEEELGFKLAEPNVYHAPKLSLSSLQKH